MCQTPLGEDSSRCHQRRWAASPKCGNAGVAARRDRRCGPVQGAEQVEAVNELPYSVAGKVAKGRVHPTTARSARVR